MSADKTRPDQGPPPVIGLGASAGGLEALTSFLSAVSPESGAVYVVVQHLDPTHAAMLAELLQRVTALPVVEAAESMMIAPDRVYVIPPNRDLSIKGDQLPYRTFDNRIAGVVITFTEITAEKSLRAALTAAHAELAARPPRSPDEPVSASVEDGVPR